MSHPNETEPPATSSIEHGQPGESVLVERTCANCGHDYFLMAVVDARAEGTKETDDWAGPVVTLRFDTTPEERDREYAERWPDPGMGADFPWGLLQILGERWAFLKGGSNPREAGMIARNRALFQRYRHHIMNEWRKALRAARDEAVQAAAAAVDGPDRPEFGGGAHG